MRLLPYLQDAVARRVLVIPTVLLSACVGIGTATDVGETCVATSDCGAGQACVSGTCELEQSESECGDGVRTGAEECDDGTENGNNAACTLLCRLNVCGDGLTLVDVEECDDGNTTTESCLYGEDGCTVCDAHCTFVD